MGRKIFDFRVRDHRIFLAGDKACGVDRIVSAEAVDSPGAVSPASIKGDIRFEGVGFTYPDGTNVLHDIAFDARPGEVVALVGLTGAGKTTLVSLIPRFYDATAGRADSRGAPRETGNLSRLRIFPSRSGPELSKPERGIR